MIVERVRAGHAHGRRVGLSGPERAFSKRWIDGVLRVFAKCRPMAHVTAIHEDELVAPSNHEIAGLKDRIVDTDFVRRPDLRARESRQLLGVERVINYMVPEQPNRTKKNNSVHDVPEQSVLLEVGLNTV